MEEIKKLVYATKFDDWEEINSSFSKGKMRIAYHGENRNGSYISKEAFDEAVPTLFNCPVVCHYNRDTDSIGGHDMAAVKDGDGLKLVNLTEPVGVVPESASYGWENVQEEGGETHEYFWCDVLLWKRQEAYSHIRENGIESQSMEITVTDGKTEDDKLFHIYGFEFNAFALLENVEPCFESAALETYSLTGFKEKFALMMEDYKNSMISPSSEEGGETEMNLDENKVFEDEVDEEAVEENQEGTSNETDIGNSEQEGDQAGETETTKDSEPSNEGAPEENKPEEDDGDDDVVVPAQRKENEFSLTAENLSSELYRLLWEDGNWCYVDHDPEKMLVYVRDWMCLAYYSFEFKMDGENVSIDFDTKRRKHIAFVDYEGDDEPKKDEMMTGLFAKLKEAEGKVAEFELRQKQERLDELFGGFADLSGNDKFEQLKKDAISMNIEDVEEKCFAIRGRNSVVKFSSSPENSIKVPIDRKIPEIVDDPYHGIFEKYNI